VQTQVKFYSAQVQMKADSNHSFTRVKLIA
jgi:hypothetical protein